ncbi:polyhomeotic-like protein 3 [Trichonephila inaurata madagascariensis]|uniref:Polyhomeotic-like protein 3 n=1 Tax=Trichonephila inaurata madagascariensis TaxID=2747483 RepID=A0A8X7BTM1_9ARAC|nr:polyhomeotic-like protein 3 [Trichonephila inaurata madagascariensis]
MTDFNRDLFIGIEIARCRCAILLTTGIVLTMQSDNIDETSKRTNELQVQVIPQHLPSTQHQYVSQIVIPGNVTLQPGSIGATSLQSIGSAPGVSLQLQAKHGMDFKTSGIQHTQPFQNAVLIQPKGPYNQVQNHIHLKHLPIRAPVASQASGTIYSHPQLIGSLALSPLPPGYTWATPNCYPQSHNPVILSREHPNIYLQSHPQTAVNLPVVTGQLMPSASLSSPAQVSQGVQTIATQTSAPSYLNSNPAYFSSQEPTEMHQMKAVTRMTYSRKALKANQKSQKSVGQKTSLDYYSDNVTLKSVSDSSTIYHAEESNSEDSVPIPSSGKENSALIHEDDIPVEEPVRKFKGINVLNTYFKCEWCGKNQRISRCTRSRRFCSISCSKRYNVAWSKRVGILELPPKSETVSRGRGRPRGRGRGRGRGRPPKPKQEEVEVNLPLPLRRSLRQKDDVEFIGTVIGESATESKASSSMIIENPGSSRMDCENVLPLNDIELDSSLESSIIGSISSETEKVATSVPGKSPDLWSVQEVFKFVADFPGCAEAAEKFKSQEIDGQALLLINLDHLMRGMSMKLGPALKLITHIRSMKDNVPI